MDKISENSLLKIKQNLLKFYQELISNRTNPNYVVKPDLLSCDWFDIIDLIKSSVELMIDDGLNPNLIFCSYLIYFKFLRWISHDMRYIEVTTLKNYNCLNYCYYYDLILIPVDFKAIGINNQGMIILGSHLIQDFDGFIINSAIDLEGNSLQGGVFLKGPELFCNTIKY